MLLGVGVVGALDEAVFYQLLQWRTLYWGPTSMDATWAMGSSIS